MWIIGSSLLELPLAMLEPETDEACLMTTAPVEEEGVCPAEEEVACGDVGPISEVGSFIDLGDGGTPFAEELLAFVVSEVDDNGAEDCVDVLSFPGVLPRPLTCASSERLCWCVRILRTAEDARRA